MTGRITACLALAAAFFVLWSGLRVREAARDGALTQPVWSCLSRPDAGRRDALSDRAFVRAIQQHLAQQPSGQSAWHWHGLVATIGAYTVYSANDRASATRAQLNALPVCAVPEASR